MKEVMTLILFMVLAFLPGIVGSQFEPGAWYTGLAKPPLTPPGFVFPVAWTILYLLTGISGYIYFSTSSKETKTAGYTVFAANLILNGLWSFLFFGEHLIGWALLDIAALASVIALNIYFFSKVRTASGVLQVPYLAWVLFAAYLNAGLYMLNR